jgi:DNA (cytosine-5)-methyltransferase 1
MEKTVVELFAGVGGFRVGLNDVKLKNGKTIEKGDWKVVWANQWEPSTKIQPAFECYEKRFGTSPSHVNKDIAKIDKKSIPNHTLLVGGFPCQDYSVARSLSKEKGIEGKKGVLWWQIYDTLIAKKTPFVLLENVDRLLKSPSKQRGRDFGIMLKSFQELDYSVEWRVINAAEYGFAQKRRRVFIFAYKNSTNYAHKIRSLNDQIYHNGLFASVFKIEDTPFKKRIKSISLDVHSSILDVSDNFKGQFFNSGIMHKGKILTIQTVPVESNKITLKSILEKHITDSKYYLSDKNIEKFDYLKGSKKIPRKKPDGSTYNYSEGKMSFPEDLNSPGRTMLTSEGTVNRSSHVVKDLTTGKLRKITPLEAERLNHFPDNWTNTGMTTRQRYFMMGNALVVGIVSKIKEYLNTIFELED